MKAIVWVMGLSGSGKATFMQTVQEDQNIAKRFGWAGKSIAISNQSIRDIGWYDGDPTDEMRAKIEEEVALLLDNHDVVLVKWQAVDSTNNRLLNLKNNHPDASHTIILLAAPLDQLVKRLKTKPWWGWRWRRRAHQPTQPTAHGRT